MPGEDCPWCAEIDVRGVDTWVGLSTIMEEEIFAGVDEPKLTSGHIDEGGYVSSQLGC